MHPLGDVDGRGEVVTDAAEVAVPVRHHHRRVVLDQLAGQNLISYATRSSPVRHRLRTRHGAIS
ncbi:hypothetical protein ACFQZ4_17725 [Catellatospora coxensis]